MTTTTTTRDRKKKVTRSDEQASLDRATKDVPRADLGTSFKTFEHILPAKLRAIAIASEALRANQEIAPHTNMWPVVEIFDLPEDGDLRYATSVGIDDPKSGIERQVFRHFEILGPCRVVHNPEMPLQGNRRRVAVMVTEAPIRVHVDTDEQTSQNGVNLENGDAPRHVPNTVQEDRSGRYDRRRFGC